ncbi:TIGR03560 family F420-dependent LLM class oxidoreductase [Thermogemmatispora sp.]|uniref:TIGR03560 family F420-dependent LLM class oxidoreductase n=1 Tax=Thermogemmatispora sp. TaxID=1968838 RepID=UPI0035E4016B
MKLGLHLAHTNWSLPAERLGATLAEVVEAAEAASFDAISVADHLWLHPIIGGPEGPQLEAYTTLGFIAAHTQRVRLLALATAVPYRHAGLLAKIVTTLDVLSGGRAMLGIGAGDYEDEALGLGLPFPPLGERFDLLEEAVQACLQMWESEWGDALPFRGRHIRMERPLNVPQSLSRPHPPILIAGSGERRTLPLVAKYADACNLRPSPEIPRQLELLRRLCAEAGRDYDAIEKTAPFGFDVGPRGEKVGQLIGQLRWLASMGIETVFGWVVGVERIEPLEIMGREVIPAVAEL